MRNNKKKKSANSLTVKNNIELKTKNQKITEENWREGKNLYLHGVAGTGKTFLGLYLALLYAENQKGYHNVTLIRSIVPTRDIGFLPGTMREKVEIYESPYYSIVSDIMGRGDAYKILRDRGDIDFVTTSFLRGKTFNDTVIVVDEVQNMSFQELDTIITRIGYNCRLILCGDTNQDDLTSERFNERSGLFEFSNIIMKMKEFKSVEFDIDDIVRSDLVKSYIIAKRKQENVQSRHGQWPFNNRK